jgi:hypothetical protein
MMPEQHSDMVDDQQVALDLLEQLSDTERAAIALHFRGLENEQVETALCLQKGCLGELRIELQKRFFAALAAGGRIRGLSGL